MQSLNRVTLIGNLGKDPEYKVLDENIAVAKFSLATSETYKDKDGANQTETQWHNIVAWRALAEVAHKYLHKGSMVYIEGKLKTRHYDDKEGNKKQVIEIIAEVIIMLDKKVTTDAQPQKATKPGTKKKEDDLPF